MAESNTEMVRSAFEAFNEGGTDAFIPYTHPEIEFSTPSELASEPDTYRGHEGVRRYWDSFFEVMDEISVEVLEVHDHGDRVIAELILRARGKATGIEAEQRAVALATIADGKAIAISFYATLDDAEAALSA